MITENKSQKNCYTTTSATTLENLDFPQSSIKDDIPIQDVPIQNNNFQENQQKQKKLADALKQRKALDDQQPQQQIQQNDNDKNQQIQMLSNGIQYLQDDLRTEQTISSGIGRIIGTNDATLKRITSGGLQDVKNFLLGGVECDLNNNIPLDPSKIKLEELKLLQSYFDRLGIPYNAKKIKVKDMLQVFIAMSSDHFHKVNNLDPISFNKVKDILKYRDFGGGNFVLTDAELEQIRQSAPDVFNKLKSSGCMQTFDNDLRKNNELNKSLANSLAKTYVDEKQEKMENSTNTMLGITVASLLLSFSSILGACGIVLTGFLATVVSFFPIISLAITIYTLVKKIQSLANNIESYNSEDKMKSVSSIGKILSQQSREKQKKLDDQTIKNKVKIGVMQEQQAQPKQFPTQQNQQMNIPNKPEEANNIEENRDIKPDIDQQKQEEIKQEKKDEKQEIDGNKNNLDPVPERSFKIKPEEEKKVKKKQKPKKNKQEETNDNLSKMYKLQAMSQMLLELNGQLEELEQRFQENVMKQENEFQKNSLKKPVKKIKKNKKEIKENIDDNKKINSQKEILELKQNLQPKNADEASLLKSQQEFLRQKGQIEQELFNKSGNAFISQKSLEELFPNSKQSSNKQQEEMLNELENKKQQLQELLKQKVLLEKQQAEMNNLKMENDNNIQQNNQNIINQDVNNSFPQYQPGSSMIATQQHLNPFMDYYNCYSNYKPSEDLYSQYNQANQQPINNQQSDINHNSVNNKQNSQSYGFGY